MARSSETEAAHRERHAAFTFTLLLAGAQTRPWRPTLAGGLGGQTPASCSGGLNQIKALLSWMNASHAFFHTLSIPLFNQKVYLEGRFSVKAHTSTTSDPTGGCRWMAARPHDAMNGD